MATVIPVSWTPTRQDLAFPTEPATGLWWRDFAHVDDAGSSPGDNTVWFPVPLWAILDFVYGPDRTPVVLVGVPHEDGLRCRLRVYRLEGDPSAYTVAGYTEVETSEVSGAALGVRASGALDLFYTQSQVLKHRRSEDGGETWETATTHSLENAAGTAFTPSQATWSIGGGDMEAASRGGFVAFDYLPNGALVLLVDGRLSGSGSDDLYMCRADASGAGWTCGKVALITSGGASIISGVQTLRGGDPLLLPWGRQVTLLQMDGTWTLQNTAAALLLQTAGVSESLNQFVTFTAPDSPAADGSGSFSWRRSQSAQFVPATPRWTGVGTASLAERFRVWTAYQRLTSGGVVVTTFRTHAGKTRMRRDGTWEHLCLDRDEQPQIIRANGMDIDGSPVTWA